MSQATATPDSTAVRTALWRALHLEVDAPPYVLEDRVGLQLAAPDADWRQRPDMNEYATPGVRASIVARARFVEDLVTEQSDYGVGQYVLLGAGLDRHVGGGCAYHRHGRQHQEHDVEHVPGQDRARRLVRQGEG